MVRYKSAVASTEYNKFHNAVLPHDIAFEL